MYDEAAEFYDVIHSSLGRNAEAEADLVIAESRRLAPHATSLLDAGCGSGAHLPQFSREFEVIGVDVSRDMLDIAAQRAPGVSLVEGDFRTFDVGRTVDIAVCLFSGIGYLVEFEDLRAGIANIARHLNPGGALLVEGWVEPEFWSGNTVRASSGNTDDLAVARAIRSSRDGMKCELEMQYVVAKPDALNMISEHHTMRLSDPAEFAEAFESAGVSFDRLPHMFHPGRSVYAGVKN